MRLVLDVINGSAFLLTLNVGAGLMSVLMTGHFLMRAHFAMQVRRPGLLSILTPQQEKCFKAWVGFKNSPQPLSIKNAYLARIHSNTHSHTHKHTYSYTLQANALTYTHKHTCAHKHIH